jgi:hypothetical protein
MISPKNKKETEATDYTLILSDIAKAIDKTNPDIPKIVELLAKLPTSEEMKNLIKVFEDKKFEFDKAGRLKVNVDRIGGVTGSIYTYLKKANGTVFNPATEEKQDDIISALDNLTGLEIPNHDYIALTYVTVGNGIGEIETAVFKTGGSGGTTVATLTLAYDANDNLISVTKT